MESQTKEQIYAISGEMLQIAFEHIPGLTEQEKALLVNLGARLYNQGVLAGIRALQPACVAAEDTHE